MISLSLKLEEIEEDDDIDVDDEVFDGDDWGDSDSSEGFDNEDSNTVDEGIDGDGD